MPDELVEKVARAILLKRYGAHTTVSWRNFVPEAKAAIAAMPRIEALVEALTPSAETKAAYIGEFGVPWPVVGEDGNDHIISINVPWATLKEIMTAILGRAALQGESEATEPAS